MSFQIDLQTFSDLEIFEGGRGNKSIFKLFNRVMTHGGKEKLFEMFCHPLSDINKIKERQDLISYVHHEHISLVINPFLLDFIETYFLLGDKPVRMSQLNAWRKALKYWIQPTNEYYIKQRGIGYMIEFLQNLYSFVKEKSQQNLPDLL
jgi:hypothetical protein